MLKCDWCGGIFEYPHVVSEYRGEFWGMPAYEDIAYCPYCGSSEIDEVQNDDEEDEG